MELNECTCIIRDTSIPACISTCISGIIYWVNLQNVPFSTQKYIHCDLEVKKKSVKKNINKRWVKKITRIRSDVLFSPFFQHLPVSGLCSFYNLFPQLCHLFQLFSTSLTLTIDRPWPWEHDTSFRRWDFMKSVWSVKKWQEILFMVGIWYFVVCFVRLYICKDIYVSEIPCCKFFVLSASGWWQTKFAYRWFIVFQVQQKSCDTWNIW